MDRRISTVDWRSQLFSLVALLGTVGMAFYLYSESANPKLTEEAIAELITTKTNEAIAANKQAVIAEVDAKISDKVESIDQRVSSFADNRTEIENDLKTLLSEFKQDSEKAIGDFQYDASLAGQDQRADFDKLLTSFQSQFGKAATELTLRPATGEQTDDTPSEDGSGSAPPALAVARLTLKTPSAAAAQAGDILVHNSGDDSIEIRELHFTPKQSYQVGELPEDESLLYDKSQVVFSADDNRASDRGKHNRYVKVLSDPVAVPAGETMSLRVLIDNAKHRDWGFEGNLIIVDEFGRQLNVGDARVRFVDGSDV
ncbi:MAG: hypothetical protein KDB27_36260 [Planctomycetales bacterium]|nr:hypothetical protein [Planctomycetales bacterium]